MAKAMSSNVRSFEGRRVLYETPRSFDQVLADLRAAVGNATHGELDSGASSSATKDEFEDRMQRLAGDSGFMLFFELNHGAWLERYGLHRKVRRWIFGNPVIAYTMTLKLAGRCRIPVRIRFAFGLRLAACAIPTACS